MTIGALRTKAGNQIIRDKALRRMLGVTAGGGGSWNPTTVTGLQFWGAARMESYVDNDAVTTFHDLSGNSNDLVAGLSPTFKTGVINSLPVVRFNGSSSDVQNATFPVIPGDLTIFLVLKSSEAGSDKSPVGRWDGAGYMLYFDGTNVRLFGGGGAENVTWTGGSQVVVCDGAFHVLTARKSSTTGEFYLDGTLQFFGSGLNASNGSPGVAFELGTYNNRGGSMPAMDVAELLVYDAPLSGTDRAYNESGLKTVYGL